MTLNNFDITFLINDNFVYYQLLFACILLTLLFLISSFSEPILIEYGIYLFIGSMAISFLLSFFTDHYWYFILHWFLSLIIYFVFWCMLIFICSRYGKSYDGDRGMLLLFPGYFLPLLIFASVLVKIAKIMIHRF
jgi:hypothetical protein